MSCTEGTSVRVHLRIEGLHGTIYEASINTRGRRVTTDAGGVNCCNCAENGRPGNPPSAGPNCTTALADAADLAGFTFDGSWNSGFRDFLITRIAGSQATKTQGWQILLNHVPIKVGGCQQRVAADQHVLFAFDGFNKARSLTLTGPNRAVVGTEIQVMVKDGRYNNPIVGAKVGGETTNDEGVAKITFRSVGVRKLKAEALCSIRSNAITVNVVAATRELEELLDSNE